MVLSQVTELSLTFLAGLFQYSYFLLKSVHLDELINKKTQRVVSLASLAQMALSRESPLANQELGPQWHRDTS